MTTSALLVLVSSVRQGRFGHVVGSWVADRAREHGGFDVEVVDLVDVDLPLALPDGSPKNDDGTYPRPPGMAPLTRALERADAVLVVTPEYNHSYPASLKAAIDWHFTQWTAKPVAFASYGGASGGRHAVLHLENVLTELHAVPLRDGLSFNEYYLNWDDGQPGDPAAQTQAKVVLDLLQWWASALSRARAQAPYPE
ncbi:NADPH-dependent FMN reductase [Pseudonocardia parietis]|uniref:NAD(P)H-dependent FMN reductase n=1 Tax=Pseudonocardia parietis TaxID=570936 RepID=A0ABS4VPK2_9PSEU|nr:NAD(P)H-dependent oxidoreductase [Pseudonocardia parietis]MBP2365678.1 NAD(P)H-dependent FMN reductase [Pseudonocardia parietis]